ncbi:MAG: alpha/beta hydrolase family protein [Myxococcales bacterium]|jgi:pimeloyl-ACP methyl ester carboxylesterase|nr:alpha/beta hydrolase family protein [Myxococcales bacterium]
MLSSRRALGFLASAVDRMATAAVRMGRTTPWSPEGDDLLSLYESIAGFYEAREASFFPEPAPIEPWAVRRGDATDLSWPSHHELLDRAVAAELSSYVANTACQVRLRSRLDEQGRRRPVAVFIHGYLAGTYAVEERIWPLERLDRLGFDTALFTLPFHGLRAVTGTRSSPPFPGRDPAINIETFRQAVCDLRDFLGWLRREGHPAVGLVGMSLGGYTAALTATVDPDLAFLVPVIPLACLVDFAVEQGHLPIGSPSALRLERALRRAYGLVSPCCRPPRIEGRRVLVIGARADQITRVNHARRLAHHFSAPLHVWPGGHLVQWGRAEAFARLTDHLGAAVRLPKD